MKSFIKFSLLALLLIVVSDVGAAPPESRQQTHENSLIMSSHNTTPTSQMQTFAETDYLQISDIRRHADLHFTNTEDVVEGVSALMRDHLLLASTNRLWVKASSNEERLRIISTLVPREIQTPATIKWLRSQALNFKDRYPGDPVYPDLILMLEQVSTLLG